MTASATIPAIDVHPPLTPIAGVDLLTGRERDADHLALALAADLAGHGATGITVATHWAQVGLLRHVAVSVEAAGTPADIVWTVLSELAAQCGGPCGLLLVDRYVGGNPNCIVCSPAP